MGNNKQAGGYERREGDMSADGGLPSGVTDDDIDDPWGDEDLADWRDEKEEKIRQAEELYDRSYQPRP